MTIFQMFWRGHKIFKHDFYLNGEQVVVYKSYVNGHWLKDTSLLSLMDQIDDIVRRYSYDGL